MQDCLLFKIEIKSVKRMFTFNKWYRSSPRGPFGPLLTVGLCSGSINGIKWQPDCLVLRTNSAIVDIQ